MKDIKLIVMDLDGTLLTDKKQISTYTAEVLIKAREKGIQVAFATARPRRSTVTVREMFEPDFYIANNGATIYFGETEKRNILFDKEDTKALVGTFLNDERIKGISFETGEGMLSNYSDFSWDKEGWNSHYYDFSQGIEVETPKISFECEDSAVMQKLVDRFPKLHMYPNHGEHWIQIMDKRATKLNGIKYICEEMGIDLENALFFGDDYNDIETLKACGVGVAVGNAVDEAKQAADYICESNNNDGVAKWIDANILNR